MKKKLCLLLALSIVGSVAFSFAGCGRGDDGDENKEYDAGASQLQISNFDGGFGSEWLNVAAKKFEALHAETPFEEGKKGVQIWVNPVKTTASGVLTTMATDGIDMYFTEQLYYYDAVSSGKFLDITDVVTENLNEKYGEDKSIESKMTAEQISYYKTADEKYYGLPHYAGYFGITYDVDLFEEQNLYFAKNENNNNDGFVISATDTRSAGPDGQEGTYDDGLPATYDDFFKLCDRIKKKSMTPIVWSGMQRNGYWQQFLNSLLANYEGLDQMMLNYTLDGTATNVVDNYTADSNGKITSMTTKSVDLTVDEGYEIFGQAGRAYALSFLERLLKGNYMHGDSTDASVTHLEAQYTFLESKLNGEAIAMVLDGNFWFAEAAQSFDTLETEFGYEAKAENRKFGFMPLPHATEDKIGKQTMLDYLYSCGFINAKIESSKIKLAKEFLQFLYTDESLQDYTVITNTTRSLNYDMGDRVNELSYYGKTLWEMKSNADVVYPFSTKSIYLNNQSTFNLYYGWNSTVGSSDKNNTVDAIRQENISAKTYFEGLKKYKSKTWNTLNK